jgi:type IV pilus assembly protein PilB
VNEIKDLERRGYIVTPYIVSTTSLQHAWTRYEDISFASSKKGGSLDISSEDIQEMMEKINTVDDVRLYVEEIMGESKSFRVSRIVEVILAGGMSVGASDIHFEPERDDVQIRYRLDGVLRVISSIDPQTYKLVLSRIKLLSGLKLNLDSDAQDGRFSVTLGEVEIELRVSLIPGAYNESIVIRLLNPENIQTEITEMGIPPFLMNILENESQRPNGLILNTGPTGSGKTTTLYSFLRRKKGPGIKIITIEDPIEYHLEGIVQTQVDKKKGYTFASGLRSSLRQDPDIIMVGEIRDNETAETAIQAALTGHMVFSTLHTNNAAGAFTRLIDLGINPKIITSAVSVAIAQRLVRKICSGCKEETQADARELELITKIYNHIQDPDKPEFNGKIYKAKGCEKCNGIGYKGRIGVFEAVFTTSEIEKIIQNNPSEREIAKSAKKQGIMTMAQDGVIKIINGITTLDEISRVIDIDLEIESIDEENTNSEA